jgi:hypothetical protein
LLAQLAEQLTLNQRVDGSSPSRPTRRKPRLVRGFYFFKQREFGKSRAERYNTPMTALAKAQAQNTGINPQFLIDANGKPTAVMLTIETWEQILPMLQNNLALETQAVLKHIPTVNETVPARVSKRFKELARGIKVETLTIQEAQAELKRLRSK